MDGQPVNDESDTEFINKKLRSDHCQHYVKSLHRSTERVFVFNTENNKLVLRRAKAIYFAKCDDCGKKFNRILIKQDAVITVSKGIKAISKL